MDSMKITQDPALAVAQILKERGTFEAVANYPDLGVVIGLTPEHWVTMSIQEEDGHDYFMWSAYRQDDTQAQDEVSCDGTIMEDVATVWTDIQAQIENQVINL